LTNLIAVAGTAALVMGVFLAPMHLAQAARSSTGQQQLLADIRPVRETLSDYDLVKDPNTGKILLRFAGGIGNYGVGKIEIVGRADPAMDPTSNALVAYQRLYKADGTFTELRVGVLSYHPEHHHYHYVNAVKYSLVDPSTKNQVVVTAAKQAFCLADVEVLDPTISTYPTQPVYNRCYNSPVADFVLMGVSPGWEDVYGKDLVGQSFDVTDLMNKPAKKYLLMETTNPDGVLVDANGGTPQTTSIEVVIGKGVTVGTGVSRPGV